MSSQPRRFRLSPYWVGFFGVAFVGLAALAAGSLQCGYAPGGQCEVWFADSTIASRRLMGWIISGLAATTLLVLGAVRGMCVELTDDELTCRFWGRTKRYRAADFGPAFVFRYHFLTLCRVQMKGKRPDLLLLGVLSDFQQVVRWIEERAPRA